MPYYFNIFKDDAVLMPHGCFRSFKNSVNRVVCPPYCDCEFPSTIIISGYRGNIPDFIKCRCGEDDPQIQSLNWMWHKCSNTNAVINGQDVTFHPTYSQGTAIIRGEQPLAANMLHFWEMRMLTPLSGTDVMFGIGTDMIDLSEFKFHFVSPLGANSQSWGLSYEGKLRHNGVRFPYCQRFSQGCIVGVLLDRMRGRLEFLNRRSQGVAFTNIPNDPNIKIYPMVGSTAAKSAIRLMNATSEPECLQLRTFQALAKQPKALEELKQMPGLKPYLNRYWFLAPPVRYSRESKANECDILDEAVLSFRSRMSRKHKLEDDDIDDIYDLYGNAHKIAFHHHPDSDDEQLNFNEYFDEYFSFLYS